MITGGSQGRHFFVDQNRDRLVFASMAGWDLLDVTLNMVLQLLIHGNGAVYIPRIAMVVAMIIRYRNRSVWGPQLIQPEGDEPDTELGLRLPFVVEVDYVSKGQAVFRGVQAVAVGSSPGGKCSKCHGVTVFFSHPT